MYGKVTQQSGLAPPSASCMVCSHAMVSLSLDTARFTLQQLVERVLKRGMAFNAPSIVAGAFMCALCVRAGRPASGAYAAEV